MPESKFVLKSRAAWAAWSPILATILATTGLGAEWFGQLSIAFEAMLGLSGAVFWAFHQFRPDPKTVTMVPKKAASTVLMVLLTLVIFCVSGCGVYMGPHGIGIGLGDSTVTVPMPAGESCSDCQPLVVSGGEASIGITGVISDAIRGGLSLIRPAPIPPAPVNVIIDTQAIERLSGPGAEPGP